MELFWTSLNISAGARPRCTSHCAKQCSTVDHPSVQPGGWSAASPVADRRSILSALYMVLSWLIPSSLATPHLRRLSVESRRPCKANIRPWSRAYGGEAAITVLIACACQIFLPELCLHGWLFHECYRFSDFVVLCFLALLPGATLMQNDLLPCRRAFHVIICLLIRICWYVIYSERLEQ
jgi:hypothetical protein